jgi:hypothetical protein
VQQWQWLDSALVKAVSRLPADRKSVEEASLRGALAAVTRRLDNLDVRIAAAFPAYGELSIPKPLAAEAAQALLAPDEAMLVYLAADDATWLWVLRRDRIAFHKIGIGAKALAHQVSVLRGALDPSRNTDFAPFPAKDAYALYQKLLGPALPLFDDSHHLIVVPDGALESLPLGVLVTNPPERDSQSPADHRNIAWLARDYAITILPAANSLGWASFDGGTLREYGRCRDASPLRGAYRGSRAWRLRQGRLLGPVCPIATVCRRFRRQFRPARGAARAPASAGSCAAHPRVIPTAAVSRRMVCLHLIAAGAP